MTLKEPSPDHTSCPNCGYHDASGKDVPRCPGCYFRFDSEPVHQAPVEKAESGGEAKLDGVSTDKAAASQSGDEVIVPAGKAAVVTVAAEKEAAAEKPEGNADAGKAVEEKL